MRTAIDITDKAFRRVLGFTRPGVMSTRSKPRSSTSSSGTAQPDMPYTPIIAKRAERLCPALQREQSSLQRRRRDPARLWRWYANYAADLTRCVPVNGKFSPRQRDVYNAVLRVMRAAMKMLVPGNTIPRYHEEVGRVMKTN